MSGGEVVRPKKAILNDNQDIDDDFVEEGRRSAKGSFMAKVLSPVIGYGNDFELLQYVYDLNMWSSLGGKKNACKDTPLRDARPHMFFSHRAPALAMARSRQSKIPNRCVALFRMASARRAQIRDESGPYTLQRTLQRKCFVCVPKCL